MKDLENLLSEEQVQEMMDMLEEQQTEIEKKEKVIGNLEIQVSELLNLNEKLNYENSIENVQVLKKELRQAKELLQSEKKKNQADTEAIQGELKQALLDKEYAKNHQKVVTRSIEVQVPYERCNNCNQTAFHQSKRDYESARAKLEDEFKKRSIIYESILLGFIAYALLTTVFMAIRTQSFLKDLVVFFNTLWRGIVTITKWILFAGKEVAMLSERIMNPTASEIVSWLLRIAVIVILVLAIIAIAWFIICWISGAYVEYCWDRISVIVLTTSIASVIYFGDWIQYIIAINQMVLLAVIQIIYIIIRWYVKGCMESRGYYR